MPSSPFQTGIGRESVIGKLDVMETEFRALVIGPAGAQDRGWKVWLIGTIGEMLGFEAQTGMRTIAPPAKAGEGRDHRSVIKLQARLVGMNVQGKTIATHKRGGETHTVADRFTEDEIVIIRR